MRKLSNDGLIKQSYTHAKTRNKGVWLEAVKIVGALAWIVGVLTWNLFVLAVALLATAYSIRKSREARHRETINAIREARQ